MVCKLTLISISINSIIVTFWKFHTLSLFLDKANLESNLYGSCIYLTSQYIFSIDTGTKHVKS